VCERALMQMYVQPGTQQQGSTRSWPLDNQQEGPCPGTAAGNSTRRAAQGG
jgi:hypothetical protein